MPIAPVPTAAATAASRLGRAVTTAATAASWAVVGVAIADSVAAVSPVVGSSMAPTLRGVADPVTLGTPCARDWVVVNWAPVAGFRRGDVVVLTDPRSGGGGGAVGGDDARGLAWLVGWATAARGERIVKRLVGLPGDLVVSTERRYGGVEGGDARLAGGGGGGSERLSVDSHVFGPVPLALLEGRVEAVVWPPSRMGRVPPPPPRPPWRGVIVRGGAGGVAVP
ncbi:hypothetical protein MMPV_008205 [Pyropia vietnamensis]